MVLQMILFFLVVVLVWGGSHAYVGWRLIHGSRLTPARRRTAWAVLVLLAALPVFVMLTGRVIPATRAGTLAWVGFLAMGFSSLVVTFALVVDLVRMGGRLAGRLGAPAVIDPSRRAFLNDVVNLGVVGTAGTLTSAGVAGAIRIPGVVEVDVPVPGLAASLDGFRIAQITDIHVGPTVGHSYLDAVVQRVNELGADMVAVTGDLVDGFVADLATEIAPLGRLRSKHGAFFVTGNHEYYWDGPAWCDEVARLGLTVLNNDHRVLEHGGARILVAGCTDRSAGRQVSGHASDPALARRGAGATAFSLLLAHQPRSVFAAVRAGYDLQISGHTHGGQYFPMNIFVHLFQPFVAGLHLVESTYLYVSRGTGYWGPPLRLGAPSEITLLRLVRA